MRSPQHQERKSLKRQFSAIQQLESLTPEQINSRIAAMSDQEKTAEINRIRQYCRSLIEASRCEDKVSVIRLVDLALVTPSALGKNSAAEVASDCIGFLEYIGELSTALRVSVIVAQWLPTVDDLNVKRRAHSVIGVCFLRSCHFNAACSHLSSALQIATHSGDVTSEFATLTNIVCLLEAMGQLSDARALSIKLRSFPAGDVRLDFLHFQNAVNGLKICMAIEDHEQAAVFFKVANNKHPVADGMMVDIAKAYYESITVEHLIQRGDFIQAERVVDEAIERRNSIDNPRVRVVLTIAKARCAQAARATIETKRLRVDLQGMLSSVENFQTHYEQLLHALIELFVDDKDIQSQVIGLSYFRELQEHLIRVKHREFFLKTASSYPSSQPSRLRNPHYEAAEEVFHFDRFGDGSSNDQLACVSQGLQKFVPFVEEAGRRSEDFDIAENWAVAAEFISGQAGNHCFAVGRLAGLIAGSYGLDEDQCLNTELACRLHDIGKIFINSGYLQRLGIVDTEDHFVLREHTLIGDRLLSCSEDRVVRLGASVARHHHEWWNGDGFPDALRGEEIPFEARICAVADTYVSMTSPASSVEKWSEAEAELQVRTMMGMQFDPSLENAFRVAVTRFTNEVPDQVQLGGLLSARQDLKRAVSSALDDTIGVSAKDKSYGA